MLNASSARQLLDVGYKPQSLGVMGANSDLDLVNSAFDKVINDVNNKTVSNDTVKMFGMWSILENPMRMAKQVTGGGMVEGLADYSTKPEVQRDLAFNAVLAHPAMGAVGGAVMAPVMGYQAGQELKRIQEGQSVMGGNAEIDRLKGELIKFDVREFAKNNPASVLTSIFPASSIGKKAGLYAGQGAKSFAKAQAEGKTFGNVADKMERWEVNDKSLILTDKFRKAKSNDNMTLRDAIYHSELFKNYPELKNINVVMDDSIHGLQDGNYNPETNSIHLDFFNSLEQQKSTLLHEIQHAVQEREGFAGGGDIQQFIGVANKKGLQLQKKLDKLNSKKNYTVEDLLEISKIKEKIDSVNPVNQYKNLAGEIESRDVSARMNLTPEQRAMTAPYSSENIPVNEWIVRRGDGTSLSIDFEKLAQQAGATYKGIQKGSNDLNIDDMVLFDNPKTKDTLSIPVSEVTPEKVKVLIEKNNKDWESETFYHGTNKQFDDFDIEHRTTGALGTGFNFTNNLKDAQQYGKIIKEATLNIKNPLDISGSIDSKTAKILSDKFGYEIKAGDNGQDVMQLLNLKVKTKIDSDNMVNTLKSAGYDGIMIKSPSGSKIVKLAFDPEQIISKSVSPLESEALKYKTAEEFKKSIANRFGETAHIINTSDLDIYETTIDRKLIESLKNRIKNGDDKVFLSGDYNEKRPAIVLGEKLSNGKYKVQDGNHRLLAAKEYGLKSIPVKIEGDNYPNLSNQVFWNKAHNRGGKQCQN